MNCQIFFDQNAENKQKCKLLHDKSQEELISFESQVASRYSPGVVDDDETVYQQIVDPTHIDPTGTGLRPTAFDVANSHGLSTNRLKFSNWSLLMAKGEERASQHNVANPGSPPRALWGFARFHVKKVREIISKSSSTRAFFVFDTAYQHDISHADICQCVLEPKTRSFRSARFDLYDLAKGNLLTISEITASIQTET